jgi:hypothetical protein
VFNYLVPLITLLHFAATRQFSRFFGSEADIRGGNRLVGDPPLAAALFTVGRIDPDAGARWKLGRSKSATVAARTGVFGWAFGFLHVDSVARD